MGWIRYLGASDPFFIAWRCVLTRVSVNLGGWLVPEPFIVPSLYEPFANNVASTTNPGPAIDEYTLMENLNSTNNVDLLIQHYETFIVRSLKYKLSGSIVADIHCLRLKKISRKLLELVLTSFDCLFLIGRLKLGRESLFSLE